MKFLVVRQYKNGESLHNKTKCWACNLSHHFYQRTNSAEKSGKITDLLTKSPLFTYLFLRSQWRVEEADKDHHMEKLLGCFTTLICRALLHISVRDLSVHWWCLRKGKLSLSKVLFFSAGEFVSIWWCRKLWRTDLKFCHFSCK